MKKISSLSGLVALIFIVATIFTSFKVSNDATPENTNEFTKHQHSDLSAHSCEKEEWGFYGHRMINRRAVFSLPSEMIGFYKKNIEWITEHAVDPDKRRYATKHEAVRHYIDVDHWDVYPFEKVPRKWTEALVKYTDIYVVNSRFDTLHLIGNDVMDIDKYKMTLRSPDLKKLFRKDTVIVYLNGYNDFYQSHIQPQYYKDEMIVDCELLKKIFKYQPLDLDCDNAFAIDRFSEYGILPFHLNRVYLQLVEAFRNKNAQHIVRLATDMGHYLGDAHVPLHTTENYNGQMTNQVGIHGFWESRLLELFSDEYDYLVGRATYIDDTQQFFWKTIMDSHVLVDSILSIEKRLSQTYPQDKQFCFENRLDATVRIQCEDYCRAFHNELKGMVEDRFTTTIHSLSSVWYTAWVDAGQPDLLELLAEEEEKLKIFKSKDDEETEKSFKGGNIKGRSHNN